MEPAMGPVPSPMDFIKPYKDSGFTALVWRKTGTAEPDLEGFVSRLTEKGLKAQTLPIPEPPPGYPTPPYYPELTLTILDPSATDVVLRMASEFLEQVYPGMEKITAKIDIILDQRFISLEANGPTTEVGETIKSVPKIEKLASSNLIVIIASNELAKPAPTKFCTKCGIAIPAQSGFCYSCGTKQ